MKLNKPEGIKTQGFGENANSYYKSAGLKGHNGEDYVLGYQKPIKAVVDGEIYSWVNKDNPDFDKYRAVYQLVEDKDFSYEVSYGHLKDILVKIGQQVKKGEVIGTEGNYGVCYSGGKLVTKEEKLTGKGSHLHFQVRKCIKVSKTSKDKKYLTTSRGKLKKDGKYFEVVDYDNGYWGCIDPKLFYDLNFLEILNILKWLKEKGIIT